MLSDPGVERGIGGQTSKSVQGHGHMGAIPGDQARNSPPRYARADSSGWASGQRRECLPSSSPIVAATWLNINKNIMCYALTPCFLAPNWFRYRIEFWHCTAGRETGLQIQRQAIGFGAFEPHDQGAGIAG